MKYIRQVRNEEIFDGKGYIRLYDFSLANKNDESRAEAVTTVAAASFGKDKCKSPKNLYEKLFNERNTTLEFIRLFPNYSIESSLRNNIHAGYTNDDFDVHNRNVAVLKVKIPLLSIAHILRHRSFSYNQCSRRYAKVSKNDLFIPHKFNEKENKYIHESIDLYFKAIERGLKPELARCILPAYIIMSELWICGNKKAWKSLFDIRLNEYEHVQGWTKTIVQKMHDIILNHQSKILI